MGYPWWSQIFVTFKMVVVTHPRGGGSNSSHSGRVFLFFKLGYDVDLLDFSPYTQTHTHTNISYFIYLCKICKEFKAWLVDGPNIGP
jgi:hypothetical protein